MTEYDPYWDELRVAKFGGSSMLGMEDVQARMEELDERRLAVVSALGKVSLTEGQEYDGPHDRKVTDRLIDYWESGDDEHVDAIIAQHAYEADRLGIFDNEDDLMNLMADFRRGITDAYTRQDEADLHIQGEIMSARLFAAYAGYTFLDPRNVIAFESAEKDPKIDLDLTSQLLQSAMSDKDTKYVLGGYGGSFVGQTVLAGRSGTDVIAAAATVALGGSVYENFKEEDGIYSANPEKLPFLRDGAPIEEMTYDEARDYGNAGAEVLHRDVIYYLWDRNDPSVDRNIVTEVKNVKGSQYPGTRIVARRESPEHEQLLGVTARDDFVYIKIHDYGMGDTSGYGRDVLDFIADYNLVAATTPEDVAEAIDYDINFDHLPTNTDSIMPIMKKEQFKQWTKKKKQSEIDALPDYYEFLADLNARFGNRIESHGEIDSLHIIGQQLDGKYRKQAMILGRLFTALHEADVATDGVDVTKTASAGVMVLYDSDKQKALEATHKVCVEDAIPLAA